MNLKRRLSVMAGLAFAGLLLIPPVYRAMAARFNPIDQDALNRRIASLEATAVDSPAALQARYRAAQESILPILPPDPDLAIGQAGGIAVFDPKDFDGWEKVLEPADLHGVTVWPVIVAEDPKTRDTLFLNGKGEVVATLAPEQDYDPFAWLADWRPDLYEKNADPDALAWAEAIYEPARISATFYLLPADAVAAMAEAQLAAEFEEETPGMNMMMGEGLPESVTNLVIFAVETATNGMALGLGWPEDFTNQIEMFARTNIAPAGWFVVSTNLSTAGTNSLWWVDMSISSNTETRFYRAGNADQDTDADGLTDARERMTWGTDETLADTDADGFTDYAEVFTYHTDPNNNDTSKPVVTIQFPANNGSWIWMP